MSSYLTTREWFKHIPLITRSYCILCTLLSVAVFLGVVRWRSLYLHVGLATNNREFWRFITPFLFAGGMGLKTIVHVVMSYNYLRKLEDIRFHDRKGDLLLMLLFCAVAMIILGSYFDIRFLSLALCLANVTVWAAYVPSTKLNFFSLFDYKLMYLPWMLLAFFVMLGGSPSEGLLGIVVGHFYNFVGEYGILRAPDFINDFLED